MQDSATIPHEELLDAIFDIATPGTFVNISGHVVNSNGAYLLDEDGKPVWSDRSNGVMPVERVGDLPTEPFDRWFTVHPRRTPKRGGEANAAEVVAIPLDFDFATSSDAKDPGRSWQDIDEVRAFCDALPVQMSALIGSGNGVQGFIFLAEPLDPLTGKGLIHRVSAFVKGEADAVGRDMDSVNDLARVMRLPGTMNRKDFGNPKPVTVIELHPERRSNLDDFDFIPNVGAVKINPDTSGIPDEDVRRWVEGLPSVMTGTLAITGWAEEMRGAVPGHIKDGRHATAMRLLGKSTRAAMKGTVDFRTAVGAIADAFAEMFDNREAARHECVTMAGSAVRYRISDATEGRR